MTTILRLMPHVEEKIWGGTKLSKLKNWHVSKKIGETWEVSTHPNGPSKFNGINLNSFIELSYLVKFIDTTDNLSIQVHPDDEYAQIENDRGKTECWLILASEKGSGIYLGLKPDVTKKEFKTAVDNGLAVDKFLNFIEVQPGDYFYVPAGTVHAIGKGVTLCEIQQASGVTYRVWDWNRLGDDGRPRDLHIEKALEVIDFTPKFNKEVLSKCKKNLFASNELIKLVEHEDFKAHLMSIHNKKIEFNLKPKESIIVLSGKIMIDDQEIKSFQSVLVNEGAMVMVSAKEQSKFLIVSE